MKATTERVVQRVVGSAAVLLALTACQDAAIPEPDTARDVPGAYTSEVVGGLRHPWDIAFLSADEALVTE